MEANGLAFDLEGGSETTPPCCHYPLAKFIPAATTHALAKTLLQPRDFLGTCFAQLF